jgi:hypothetical protein
MVEMERDEPFQLAEAMSVLARTPATVRALLEGLDDEWLEFKEDPEAWSPRTVLVHYIHNERTNWIPRARVLLTEEQVRKFPPFHQLPEESQSKDAPVGQLLAEFADLRRESLSALSSLALKPGDFAREAEHPVLGMVNLRQLLATWVVHDLNHLDQIAKSLAARYRDAVGPWRRNLAILGR